MLVFFFKIADEKLKLKIHIKKTEILFIGLLKIILAWQQRPIIVEFGTCCSIQYDLVRIT